MCRMRPSQPSSSPDRPAELDLDEADLDLLIGAAIAETSFGSKDLSDGEKREIAQEWFAERADDVRTAVCSSPVVTTYLHPRSATERELYDAVLGALTYLTAIPVPLGLLAAKVLRYGLHRLCPDIAEEAQPG
jgi:hypothetical protein